MPIAHNLAWMCSVKIHKRGVNDLACLAAHRGKALCLSSFIDFVTFDTYFYCTSVQILVSKCSEMRQKGSKITKISSPGPLSPPECKILETPLTSGV